VKLIVSSSINNNDVRSLLLKTWFPDYDKVSLLFPYSYFDNLFDSNLIVEFDQSLSESQRIYINDYFNNIPKFYYEIKNKKDEELEGYKNYQQKKIFDKITSFYEDNLLSFNDFEILLNYRHKIGKILKEDEFYQLIKILPIKYFTLRNNVINFYFSLVENAFDEYLSNKIYSLLRGPMHGIADRIIGDMLEFILLTDLKNNKFAKFDETIKIESIWDLSTNENFKINNIEGKDILILQTEPKARFLDFGILSKSNILILFQCKKALAKEPKEYITRKIIDDNKEIISNNFKLKFNADIKKIYLLYITGISFYFDEKDKIQKLKPWGNKEYETFEINEKICKVGDCRLIFYDPLEKKIYIKIDENAANIIDSLIKFSETLIEIEVNKEDNSENVKQYQKRNIKKNENSPIKYNLDSTSIYQDRLKKIRDKKKDEEEFFETKDFPLILKNNIPIDTNTYGI
jgi:hypothetical protein